MQGHAGAPALKQRTCAPLFTHPACSQISPRDLLPNLTPSPAGQFIGALDGLLVNRRLATLIFALVDVLLIWVAIKVFRSAVLHE